MLTCLLVARKDNLTGFSTGLTGRLKNLDPTGNPPGRSTRPATRPAGQPDRQPARPVNPTGAGRPDRFPSLLQSTQKLSIYYITSKTVRLYHKIKHKTM